MAHPNETGGGRPRPGLGRAARRGFRHAAQQMVQPQIQQMQAGGDGGGQPPVQQPPVDVYDPSTDPTLQRIRAFGAARLADAQAAAINARTQAAADYADVQAQDARDQVAQPRQLVGNLSKQNLGYSSEGANQQSSLARALTESANLHQRNQQARLQGIQDTLTGVQQDVAGNDIQAQQDAADRLRNQLGDLNMGGGQGQGFGQAHAQTGAAAQALAEHMRRRRRAPQHAPIPHLPGGGPP